MHKISRAWNGDDILRLPVDPHLISKIFTTYDRKNYKPISSVMPQQSRPADTGSRQKDESVVIEALQRILRGKEDTPKNFGELGTSRPIR